MEMEALTLETMQLSIDDRFGLFRANVHSRDSDSCLNAIQHRDIWLG